MRYAVISDIHSNVQALKTAFKIFEDKNIDRIVCLGDIVGYNARPVKCIDLVRAHPKVSRIVSGNHDVDSARFEDLRFGETMEMSKDAYDGMKYSHSCLSDKHKEWLQSLDSEELIKDPKLPFFISHYSPNYCTWHGYIISESEALMSMKTLKLMEQANIFFFGHSHLPTFIAEDSIWGHKSNIIYKIGRKLAGNTYVLEAGKNYLINPGTIGQPRGHGVTSYAIFDTDESTIRWESFEYNFKAARKDVLAAGYSQAIASRLDMNYDEKAAKKTAKKARCKAKQKQLEANKR